MAQAQAQILDFPTFTVVEGGAKVAKDGHIKRTHSNAVTGRSTWVDPIRNLEDIYRVIDYLQSKIDNEPRADYRRAWARNKMYFGIGVFSGFRVSDLLSLKWSDIFEADGKTYRENRGIIEKKTGKMKRLYITEASRRYIDEYIALIHPDTASDEYLFLNRQGKQMNRQTADDFIKDAARACNLKGNYSTHSVRKTYAYQMYMQMIKSGNAFALPVIQKFLNHRNTDTTLRYLGVDQEMQTEAMNDFSEAMLQYQNNR